MASISLSIPRFQRVWRAWCDERGENLVESAVVFSLLLTLVLGMVDFGLLLQGYITVAGAANAGATYGAASLANANDLNGIRTAATAVSSNWSCANNLDNTPSVQRAALVSDGVPLPTGNGTYSKITVTVTCQVNDLLQLSGPVRVSQSVTRRVHP
jgi:Flp pilus assembly protein TadG